MDSSKPTVIFFGNERLASSVQEEGLLLQSLIDQGYNVSHLIVKHAEKKSRKQRQDKVVSIANANNITVVNNWDEQNVIRLIKDSGAKVGILAAFGRIIPLSVINAFPGGILNIHPSLLPKYRGSTPIEAAILNGDRLTGVSLMRLAQKMDAGPIFGQAELPLLGNESKQEIFEQLVERAASLLTTLLPDILSGSVAAAPQDESYATYVHTLTKEDGRIDWHKPAEIIEREIRAYLGWPGSYTELAGTPVTIIEASVSDATGTAGSVFIDKKRIGVFCATGALLIERLKPAGKKEMSSEAFLAGHPELKQ